MHVRELVELAALVAVHGPILVRSGQRVPHSAIEQYWVASKCRIDRWLRLLRRLADAAGQFPRPATLAWPRIGPACEEILASELLTRIWTAAAVACDEHHADENLSPIARNVWLGHLDVRRRLLQLVADGRAFTPEQATKINHLRRRLERWNDMLLAHLSSLPGTAEFAFDPARAGDFAEDLDPATTFADRSFTCQLVQASLTASLGGILQGSSPNADLNRQIASAIFACLPDDLLAGRQSAGSLWLDRLVRTAAHAQQMVDDLVRLG
ncbi:MAG TPA: hypothetical protein VFV87_12000 [Pirellulaceae bacterium]|nr:hypothetical protein [Pirellulaceae bacterium]